MGWDQFKLNSGEDNLSCYEFNKYCIQYLFCKICGIEGFVYGMKFDGFVVVVVNVNCFDGVDLCSLNLYVVDGVFL